MKAAHFPVLFGKSSVPAPRLSFSGALTVVSGSAGPHFTLVVLNNPATNPYDGFAEVTDADGVSTLANGDEVTISGALGAHAVSYKATSSGGRPDMLISLTTTIIATIGAILLHDASSHVLLHDGVSFLRLGH